MREGSLQVSELLLLGKSSPDRGNSRYKGPEAGVCLIQYLATSWGFNCGQGRYSEVMFLWRGPEIGVSPKSISQLVRGRS